MHAQDVESFFGGISERLRARDYVRFSGSLNARLGLNAFSGGDGRARRRGAPFIWGANGAVNFDVLGIQAPLSVAVSSRNTLYNLPSYRFVGLSPSYRWITLHGGDRSLTFSPYSLSGINFRGGGFELTPGKFYAAGMHGRLRRARVQDAGAIQNIETELRRTGSGAKVGYDNGNGTAAGLSLFHSRDEQPPAGPADTLALASAPERNLVLTLDAAHRFSDFLSVDAEWAQSVLTRDDTAPYLSDPAGRLTLLGLFRPRTTTTSSNALRGRVTLSPKFGQLNLQYERVAPEYRTHGSLFFQNDSENITAGVSAPLFDDKLTASLNAGVQRNDLAGNRARAVRRFIGSLALNYALSERVTTNLNLSNLNSTSRLRARAALDPLTADSIVLAQTQFSGSLGATVLLDDRQENVLVLSGSYQRAGLIRNEVLDSSQLSRFATAVVGYTRAAGEGGGGSFSASVVVNRSSLPGLAVTTLGPTLGYGRPVFGERGNLQAGLGYSLAWVGGGGATGGALQGQLGGRYAITEKQSVNLQLLTVHSAGGAGVPAFTDAQLNLSYGLNF